jgi:hypothetical protein
MHNVSEGGLAFWSRTTLELGQTIYLREFTDEPRPWLKARVAHRTRGIRGFLIGCEFELP